MTGAVAADGLKEAACLIPVALGLIAWRWERSVQSR
jgi:hypothetical protein